MTGRVLKTGTKMGSTGKVLVVSTSVGMNNALDSGIAGKLEKTQQRRSIKQLIPCQEGF